MSGSIPPLGGEFEISLETLLEATGETPDWPFDSYCTVTSGRTALGVAAGLIERPGPVLLPSYLCDSVIQPFREAGREVAFYPVDEALALDPDALAELVERLRPAGVVLIPYFGFPVQPDVAALFGDALVIEDRTQCALLERPEPVGDVVVTSFRKYLPVPDGGLVISREPRELPSLPPATLAGWVGMLALGKAVRARAPESDSVDELLDRAYELAKTADRQLDVRVPWEGMSELSGRLLSQLDLEAAGQARRANYERLLAAFAAEPRLAAAAPPLRPELPDDVSPFVFAVRVLDGRRDEMREVLQRSRIFCGVLWPLPAEIDAPAFPASHRLSGEILCLPVDQRYGEREMAWMADRLGEGLLGAVAA
jgi:hypothetical protein